MIRARTAEAKDQRRQRLVEAALDEFSERGFAAARMEDIASRAGLSKGTLYLYFDSKEGLFEELIDTIAVPNVERIEELARAAPSATQAIEAFLEVAGQLVRESKLPRVVKTLIADSGAFPELVSRYRTDVLDRVLAAFAGVLARAHEAGELEIEDPDLTARLVLAPVVFSAIWSVVFETPEERDQGSGVDVGRLLALHRRNLLTALGAGVSS